MSHKRMRQDQLLVVLRQARHRIRLVLADSQQVLRGAAEAGPPARAGQVGMGLHAVCKGGWACTPLLHSAFITNVKLRCKHSSRRRAVPDRSAARNQRAGRMRRAFNRCTMFSSDRARALA